MNMEVFVGLDVNRTAIQIAVRPSGEHWTSAVDESGINETAAKLGDIHPDLVVMEAHGGPELPVAGTLASVGLPFALVSPRSIREFAKAIGRTRRDADQAGLLAHFAELVRPEVRKVPAELVKQLKSLRSRRLDVVKMLLLERSRLDADLAFIQRDVRNHIFSLEKALLGIDEEISRTVRSSGRT